MDFVELMVKFAWIVCRDVVIKDNHQEEGNSQNVCENGQLNVTDHCGRMNQYLNSDL